MQGWVPLTPRSGAGSKGRGCAKRPGLCPAAGAGSGSPAGAAQGCLTSSGSSQVEPVSSRQGQERPRTWEASGDAVAQRAVRFGTVVCHLPVLAGSICAVGTSSVLQGGQIVGGASLPVLHPFPRCVPKLSLSVAFTAFALSVCTSPPPRALVSASRRLCVCLPSPGCVRVFLTDCAISVCPYLSLTRTTKQRYAHLLFHRVCLLVSHLSLPGKARGPCTLQRRVRPQRGRGALAVRGAALRAAGLLCSASPGACENLACWAGGAGQGCLLCAASPAFGGGLLGCCGGVSSRGCVGLSGEVGRVAKPPVAERRVPGEAQREERSGPGLPSSLWGEAEDLEGIPVPLRMS